MSTCAHAPVWLDFWTDEQSAGANLCELMGAFYTKRAEMSREKAKCVIALPKEKCFFLSKQMVVFGIV